MGKHGLGQLLFNFSLHILKVFEASDWRQRDSDSLSLHYREQVVRDWEIQGEAQLAPASASTEGGCQGIIRHTRKG